MPNYVQSKNNLMSLENNICAIIKVADRKYPTTAICINYNSKTDFCCLKVKKMHFSVGTRNKRLKQQACFKNHLVRSNFHFLFLNFILNKRTLIKCKYLSRHKSR